jgi:hypothetical protein
MAGKAGVKKTGLAMAQPPEVFYRINSLLYTLRTIAQREDQLCMLMHHLRTSGKLNAGLAAELHEILDEIPGEDYLHDLQALRASLEAVEGGAGRESAARVRSGAKRRAA